MKYKIRKRKIKRITNLKIILKKKKISQTELAKLSDLEIYQVSNIVSGKQKDILLSTAKRICNALNISLNDAFGELGDCEHEYKYLSFENDGKIICNRCGKQLGTIELSK
jgi:transcriptional regulator with XRE-family HTH domain